MTGLSSWVSAIHRAQNWSLLLTGWWEAQALCGLWLTSLNIIISTLFMKPVNKPGVAEDPEQLTSTGYVPNRLLSAAVSTADAFWGSLMWDTKFHILCAHLICPSTCLSPRRQYIWFSNLALFRTPINQPSHLVLYTVCTLGSIFLGSYRVK